MKTKKQSSIKYLTMMCIIVLSSFLTAIEVKFSDIQGDYISVSTLYVVGVSSFSSPISVLGVFNPTVPRGGIIMYSGPWYFNSEGLGIGLLEGWALCNGKNGTPDLSDKFILVTNIQDELGQTGGTHYYYLSVEQLPSHSHNFEKDVNLHVHAVYSDPTQGYINIPEPAVIGTPLPFWWSEFSTYSSTYTVSGITSSVGDGVVIDNRPAFIKLAFIMKL